jgi:hypothetical protein
MKAEMKKIFIFSVILLLGVTPPAWVLLFGGNTGASTEDLGNYSGALTYASSSDTMAAIAVEIANTSPVANGGGSDQVPGKPVSDPAKLLLVGFGLIGIAGLGRKQFIKKK